MTSHNNLHSAAVVLPMTSRPWEQTAASTLRSCTLLKWGLPAFSRCLGSCGAATRLSQLRGLSLIISFQKLSPVQLQQNRVRGIDQASRHHVVSTRLTSNVSLAIWHQSRSRRAILIPADGLTFVSLQPACQPQLALRRLRNPRDAWKAMLRENRPDLVQSFQLAC